MLNFNCSKIQFFLIFDAHDFAFLLIHAERGRANVHLETNSQEGGKEILKLGRGGIFLEIRDPKRYASYNGER